MKRGEGLNYRYYGRGRQSPFRLAKLCWALRLERLGNHFENVAVGGKGWFGG